VLDEKIARAVTIVDPKGRAAAYAELEKLIRDEAPWVFLWQQHDLYGVANYVEWTPRPDEKMWMYEAKVTPR
jgi:peptide/nickel transport system substrate-binding protein